MKNFLPAGLVRQSLSGHSWIGLLVGILMYLVCLSGTLAVFYQELERWEQPGVVEYLDYSPQALSKAFNRVMQSEVELTDHMYITLPSEAIPRAVVSTEAQGWFVNQDGSLAESTRHDWTHLLVDLHLYLHLPETWGMILVSALGVMLCALIVSGFLAHPRLFRDAFHFRTGGSARLKQVDLHNRLSVWGAPFYLIIGVTGAWFGLVMLVLGLYGFLTGSDPTTLQAAVFGEEPGLNQPVQTVAVDRALEQMPVLAPDARPLYITLHEAGSPAQFMEIYAYHPRRLIYGESYRFDTEGHYLGRVGFLDGEPGKQAIFSIYRLHFGHFGSFWVKVLYGVLGLALTIVSVSGINIWLLRRGRNDWLEPAWRGLVWGVPLALAVSASSHLLLGLRATWPFWGVILLACGYALWRGDSRRSSAHLQCLTVLAIGLLVLGYIIRHGSWAFGPAALGVNLAWLVAAFVFAVLAWRQAIDAE